MLLFARAVARVDVALVSTMLLGACSESGPRIYTAQLYRRAGCLEPYAPLGLVQSSELDARCEPACLLLDGELYVSSVCSPYPTRASVAPAGSAGCAAALAAFARGAVCEPSDAAVSDGSVTTTSRASPTDVDAAPSPE